MVRHRVFLERPAKDLAEGAIVEVGGAEAEHAIRSKRLRVGDEVEAFDGSGVLLRCRVEQASKRGMSVGVLSREDVAPVRPAIEVWSATPKGARLDKMIDMLAQVGAASWTPVETKLGVVDPGAGKMDRMRRIAVEGAKQCGSVHVLHIGAKSRFADAIRAEEDVGIVVADGSGDAYEPSGCARIRVLVGPEGGFLAEEVDTARHAGAQVVSLGPHAMRIETAAIVAAAMALEKESRDRK